MYRKTADRLIVKDVHTRLAEMRKDWPWADWPMAVLASRSEHPDWFRHHGSDFVESMKPLLVADGVDMTKSVKPFSFVGNLAPD
jgi:hypothetical protein